MNADVETRPSKRAARHGKRTIALGRHGKRALVAACCCGAALLSCSSDDGSSPGSGDGDGSLVASGGMDPAAGGSTGGSAGPSGGAPATGGAATGGNGATGGADASGGTAGSGGANASGGADPGTGGQTSVETSDGCGAPYSGATGQWSEQSAVNIQGVDRQWSIYVPNNYDPSRAYPLVVLLHGCTSGTNNVPIQNASGDDALLVRGTAADGNCWETGEVPNLEFFDAMVAGIGSQTCVDESRIFAAGYSSGAWLMSRLGCQRADVLRAVGTVAGGDALWNPPECNGQVGAIFVHDTEDMDNGIEGSESVRDRLLEQNGCGEAEALSSTPIEPSPCEEYLDCPADSPIVWCPTTGEGHSRQDQFAAPLMWDFFSRF